MPSELRDIINIKPATLMIVCRDTNHASEFYGQFISRGRAGIHTGILWLYPDTYKNELSRERVFTARKTWVIFLNGWGSKVSWTEWNEAFNTITAEVERRNNERTPANL